MLLHDSSICLIAAASVAGILFRPWNLPEAVWPCLGSLLLIVSGLLPLSQAVAAAGQGTDVYLFLTGMMMLAELARREGVFDWLAFLALRAADGSRNRLFTLVYLVGTAVTVFLSNDATAVVLTPAVYAAVRRARAEPLPYLFICAFVANAASFVLPISNPANLVVYGTALPPLLPWLRVFLIPSVFSIALTYATLRWLSRGSLQGRFPDPGDSTSLSRSGKLAFIGILATAAVLLIASALGKPLGLPACIAALAATLLATSFRPRSLAEVVAGVSWSVLPLVAGLFILVEAANRAGAQQSLVHFLQACSHAPPVWGALGASFGVAALSNAVNNLPSGLLAGGALHAAPVPAFIRDSILIGVDLGPNLSVTGSLATVLWLIALRREGVSISAFQFLKAGLLVMPPALLFATLTAALLH